jgi:hypothetical protein
MTPMTKPTSLIPADLLQSVTSAKPAEAASVPTKRAGTPAKGAATKANAKPAKAVQSHTRTSNRGK